MIDWTEQCGVRLKQFEDVLTSLLYSNNRITLELLPSYVPLPILSGDDIPEKASWPPKLLEQVPAAPWPFNILPESVGVRSHHTNKTRDEGLSKSLRKEFQVQSMLRCILSLIPETFLGPVASCDDASDFRIVDFAGGTGSLAIAMALLVPRCQVILVDLKSASIQLVHQKAENMAKIHLEHIPTRKQTDHGLTPNELMPCKNIPNLYTYYGSIESFCSNPDRPSFDIGLCLHACGEASDTVLRACGEINASFVVCPCCVGKLSRHKSNPYVFQATSTNTPTFSYPQSQAFCSVLMPEQFDVLAKAADYSDYSHMRSSKFASRRLAKSIIETDRMLYMKEHYKYDHVVLTKMEPLEASPKNDILIGWKTGRNARDPYQSMGGISLVSTCIDANADIQRAIDYLAGAKDCVRPNLEQAIEWTHMEEKFIRETLQNFINSKEIRYTFQSGMGPRRRKLVHYFATEFGLDHWSDGHSKTEKTVIVEKRKI